MCVFVFYSRGNSVFTFERGFKAVFYDRHRSASFRILSQTLLLSVSPVLGRIHPFKRSARTEQVLMLTDLCNLVGRRVEKIPI